MMLNIQDISAQLAARKRNFSLSRELYADAGVLEADLQHINRGWHRAT